MSAAKWPIALMLWTSAAIALDVGVARVTYGALLPGIVSELGLNYTAAGLMSTINLIAYLAGGLAAPTLARKVGYRSLAVHGHVAVALGAVISAGATGAIVLGVGRMLMGGGAGLGLIALFSLLLSRTVPERRAHASAIAWSGFGAAIMLTGVILAAMPHIAADWRQLFLLSALAGVVITAALWRSTRSDHVAQVALSAPTDASRGAAAPLRLWVFFFVAYHLFGVGYISYSTFAGVRMAADGASPTAIAVMWIVLGASAIAGCGIVAALLSWPASNRFTLAVVMGFGAIGSGVLAFAGSSVSTPAAVLVGLGLAATPAAITAMVRSRTNAEDYARLFSIATAWMGVGQIAGPSISGALADSFGPPAISQFAAGAYALGTVAALLDIGFTRAVRRRQIS